MIKDFGAIFNSVGGAFLAVLCGLSLLAYVLRPWLLLPPVCRDESAVVSVGYASVCAPGATVASEPYSDGKRLVTCRCPVVGAVTPPEPTEPTP